MKNKLDVLAIVGPTASGKTALSVELAKLLDGEIINGDSTQVYKGFDIGTAKITQDEMDGVPHHLFDTKEPTESFSVAEYQTEVRSWIKDIQARGKLPIIVGGTGLYIQSVLYDFRFTEEASNPEVRNRLENVLEEKGPDYLYEKLVRIDPVGAEKIHPNNHRRIIRALEIIEVTGRTKNEHEQNAGNQALFNHLIIGLDMNREVLYDRINMRSEMMMEQGFLDEVNNLLQKGIQDTQSMRAIGYRELQGYLEGKMSYEEAVEAIKKSTRNYAKRQMTYFRNKLDIIWFDAERGTKEILKEISIILKDFQVLQRNR
ncbi:tRNA (adenosine(37)-N6)-dimethylallyltransferase MiaA [Sporosarcina ureilytica]|uniref:tRNA dimethylallyltransferase n=1 Tax=Sporosarcina ureilytica TaxID=298596 RepID=A0A1D8JHK2_9BACL|nr:tRNA (adenosine(37)-N6)-dimethylallyltransferase MiaA [Sporosarcina ureilytica]AOV08200.1 tRNA (adenosine(37)-N6)-dimethylallyltransferase MiaA [Sporosarcina ureilytica]